MANCVRSISRFSTSAGSVKATGSSPAFRSGKSASGSICSAKRARPAFSAIVCPDLGIERDLGAVGQLSHDVVEHVRGNRARARLLDRGRHAVDDLHVEVGRLQRQLVALGAQEHVGEDRDGVAPLDDAMDVVERLQEVRPFDSARA